MAVDIHPRTRPSVHEALVRLLVPLLVRLLELLDPTNTLRNPAGSPPAPSRRLHLCRYDPPQGPRPTGPPSLDSYRNERRERRRRRMAPLLALDDIDVGPLVMHGVPSPPPPPEYGRRYGSPC